MGLPPWSDADTAELLGLAVDALAAGDARGGTLLSTILTRECGREFADRVASAIAAGTPPEAFDFLPAATGRRPVPEGSPASPSRPSRPSPAEPVALPSSGYVSAAQVAAHFGVSAKAVYRWMASGRIRAERRPGGSYRIPAEQFQTASEG